MKSHSVTIKPGTCKSLREQQSINLHLVWKERQLGSTTHGEIGRSPDVAYIHDLYFHEIGAWDQGSYLKAGDVK